MEADCVRKKVFQNENNLRNACLGDEDDCGISTQFIFSNVQLNTIG